jgi:hypothetical protein
MCVSPADYDKITKITKLRQVRIILPFSKLSDKIKQIHLGTSTKYTHKSYMSAVVYTSTSHRPTHLNFKVLQSSYRFSHIAKTNSFSKQIQQQCQKGFVGDNTWFYFKIIFWRTSHRRIFVYEKGYVLRLKPKMIYQQVLDSNSGIHGSSNVINIISFMYMVILQTNINSYFFYKRSDLLIYLYYI